MREIAQYLRYLYLHIVFNCDTTCRPNRLISTEFVNLLKMESELLTYKEEAYIIFVETMYNCSWKDEVKHPLCFWHFVPSPFCEGVCKQQKIAFNGSVYSTNIHIWLCL